MSLQNESCGIMQEETRVCEAVRAGQKAVPQHPLREATTNELRQREQAKQRETGLIYGLHFPLRARMERELLSNTRRLPGIPSSFVGLEVVMGLDEELNVKDYMGVDENERSGVYTSAHECFEERC